MRMKVGIIGAGFVGAACAKAMLLRGTCHEIVLFDTKTHEIDDPHSEEKRTIRLDQGLATDLSHAEVLCPPCRVRAGGYEEMADAIVVVITAGINEMAGRAIDRADVMGRNRLVPTNGPIYDDIVPRIVTVSPSVPILVVTDPPDALAEVARRHVEDNPVISAGTYLDSLRLRWQIGRRLGCHPSSVDASVIGEHGTSQVYVWSSAQVGDRLVLELAEQAGHEPERFKQEVGDAVRYANIDIIEGTGASQHGIGVVTARIVEAILRDEELVAPIGAHHDQFGTTLSLPSVIGAGGVKRVLAPRLSAYEKEALESSAAAIRAAVALHPP